MGRSDERGPSRGQNEKDDADQESCVHMIVRDGVRIRTDLEVDQGLVIGDGD